MRNQCIEDARIKLSSSPLAGNMHKSSLDRLIAEGTKHVDGMATLAHPLQAPWVT